MDQPKLPYVVFSRVDSPSLWVRFSIQGHGQKRICLKTSIEEEAKRNAEYEYRRVLWSAEQGTLPGKTSFDKVARQYLERAQLEAGSNPSKLSKVAADRGVLDRYMVPFFGRSPITAISVPKLTATWNGGEATGRAVLGQKRRISPTSERDAELSVPPNISKRRSARCAEKPSPCAARFSREHVSVAGQIANVLIHVGVRSLKLDDERQPTIRFASPFGAATPEKARQLVRFPAELVASFDAEASKVMAYGMRPWLSRRHHTPQG